MFVDYVRVYQGEWTVNETGDPNANAGDGNTAGTTATNYNDTVVTHFNLDGQTASAIRLTIENTGADEITVSAVSANNDALDKFFVGAQVGARRPHRRHIDGGIASRDDLPNWDVQATASFEVLWSKETGGNWMLKPEDLGPVDTSYDRRLGHWWR